MKVRFENAKQANPTSDSGFRVDYAPAKRAAFRGRWYLMLLLVISPILLWGWYLTRDEVLTRADGILTTEPVILRAPQDAFVNEILAEPGAHLEAGQPLVDLTSPETDRSIETWQANVKTLRTQQDDLIDRLKTAQEAHGKRLQAAQAEQDEIAAQYTALEEKGLFKLADQMQLNEDRRDLWRDLRDLEQESARIDSLRFSDDLAQEIRELELNIAVAETRQDQLDLRARQSGLVNRVMVQEGEFVSEGDDIAEISNRAAPVVDVYLQPDRMKHASVGQSVTVLLPDGSRHGGEIRDPAQVAETIPPALAGPFEGTQRAIKVVVHLKETPANWVEGLPVEVRF